ncbi:MAG: ArnT family glycosyltransferase [Candidatus Hodarchaeales archaeon]|jgi:hypothetical protein
MERDIPTHWKIHAILLVLFMLTLFLRLAVIAEYGLSTDEVNKVLATRSYKKMDFSANAAHPALMKLAMTLSVMLLGETEFAIRLPNVIVSALTIYPLFLLGRKLYDDKTGLLASFLWAVHIPVISFSTTAKEDTFLTFFWILALYYFIQARENPKYFSHTGLCVGFAAASKYSAFLLVFILGLLIFISRREGKTLPPIREIASRSIPSGTIAFMVGNFPLFFPATIANLLDHYRPGSPSHTGWLMMGEILLFRPPYYLLLHIILKTPIPVVVLTVLGILYAIKDKKSSDKILLIWIAIPLGFFSVATYSFARYYLVVIPPFVFASAQAVHRLSTWLVSQVNKFEQDFPTKISSTATTLIIMAICFYSIVVAAEISPHYRMYVNEFGGGLNKAGYYFPNDSVYDAYLREATQYVSEQARGGTVIAMSEPIVGEYYGRSDLRYVYIRDLPSDIDQWGDYNVSFVIVQGSRVYYENQLQIENLQNDLSPAKTFLVFKTVVVEVYQLNF